MNIPQHLFFSILQIQIIYSCSLRFTPATSYLTMIDITIAREMQQTGDHMIMELIASLHNL